MTAVYAPCFRCRVPKREIPSPEFGLTTKSKPYAKGTCPACNGMLFTLVKRVVYDEATAE